MLLGQNWSLATMNSSGITPRAEAPPTVIDAQYVAGFVFTRQPQIRLTYDWHKEFWRRSRWKTHRPPSPVAPTCSCRGSRRSTTALPGNGTGGSLLYNATSFSLNDVAGRDRQVRRGRDARRPQAARRSLGHGAQLL
ncbi:MAG: hypothetical protein WDM85_11685 [Caulobacteraceae bacterium]